ncbi:Bax inhibitor-1 family protein [Uliginosibacterium sp. 31-16]|uniref:Bax inhibitor-1/YccA family protein n=1 Tax=Uliginosibacterium sp. 31-16 TaxID=3068315 RepID=UPI00273D2DC5|nr:Bax inhibitor-1 family protein [Uliginosibacterium sp. 31-16]MDP5238061.1 Bax inhibitor-1 family protein [Uliginosibacterium sp. 31-16]
MEPVNPDGQAALSGLSERASFLRATYLHLAGAIAGFVLLSFILNAAGVGVQMLQWMAGAKYGWLLFLGGFMVVGWLATSMADGAASNAAQLGGLGIYVVAESVIFAPMFALAQYVAPGAIGSAAFLTVLLCAALTWTAFTSKTDFSFLGGILKVAGLCAIGAIVTGVIFGFSLGIWFSAIMIVFAGGCVLFDTGKIIHHYPVDRPAGAALHLFASVALMLWYVLRLLMQLSGRD